MPTLIANYEEPRQLFAQLWQEQGQQRILLWQGESGSGKSTLIEHCLEHLPENSFHVPIAMQSAVTITEIFYWMVRVLGADNLPNFARQVAILTGAAEVKIDSNWLAGINNRISVSLHTDNLQDQERRRAALTHALFDDLERWQMPVLFVFDTFEKAATSVADWVQGPFLSGAFLVEPVRVLVAGQIVPDHKNIVWGKGCIYHELRGVPKAEAWLPVVEALNRRIPHHEPLGYLAAYCKMLKGQPSAILNVIEGWPLWEGTG